MNSIKVKKKGKEDSITSAKKTKKGYSRNDHCSRENQDKNCQIMRQGINLCKKKREKF